MPVRIGTASWTDKTLLACGRFYPKSATSAEARLRYYASQFPLVEVDSSYYAMPAPNTAQLWAERTPNDFVMNVKSFRLFTGHQTSPTVLPVEDHWRHPYVYSSDATGYTIESFGKDGIDGPASSYTTRFEFDRDLVLINGMFVASPES